MNYAKAFVLFHVLLQGLIIEHNEEYFAIRNGSFGTIEQDVDGNEIFVDRDLSVRKLIELASSLSDGYLEGILSLAQMMTAPVAPGGYVH